jgi:[acyl-carrier-protein] S-malonyltransferase
VRWQQSVEAMIANGVEVFIEIGPGKTLSSFVKKLDKTKIVINIDKVEDLDKLSEL